MKTTEGYDDDYIQERACQERGCGNWAESGVIYCNYHLHGGSRAMPTAVAVRKRELEIPACPYPIATKGPAQCCEGHWLGSPHHPIK